MPDNSRTPLRLAYNQAKDSHRERQSPTAHLPLARPSARRQRLPGRLPDQLPAADLDPADHTRLSYQQAEALFSAASGGATLH